MNISEVFYVIVTISSIIVVFLSIYVVVRFIKTLEEIELFLKDMRHLTTESHNSPKVGAGILGITANILQFIAGRR